MCAESSLFAIIILMSKDGFQEGSVDGVNVFNDAELEGAKTALDADIVDAAKQVLYDEGIGILKDVHGANVAAPWQSHVAGEQQPRVVSSGDDYVQWSNGLVEIKIGDTWYESE